MSKAFTREDDGADDLDDEDPSDRLPKGDEKRYITPEGFQRIEKELAALWSVERPRITQEVADAAAQGDRSENAEYIYGKRKLREIDKRIRYLSKLLDRLTVVVPTARTDGRAYFGARVTLEDEKGERTTYRLVGPDESDIENGELSVESPIGKALLGKSEGDDITVVRPKGSAEFSVIRVEY